MSTWSNDHFTLNTGAKIPAVGLGTWNSPPGEVRAAVKTALDAGYRHIDGAAAYNNEKEVGQGIRDWTGGDPEKRKQIFLTTKIWNNRRRAEDIPVALSESLELLGVDYVDLYLVHWPINFKPGANQYPQNPDGTISLDTSIPFSETWAAMEKVYEAGQAKAIGISNFNQWRIDELLKTARVVPAVNQIEAHPWLAQNDLKKYHDEKGIHITAYSPLGNNIYGLPRVMDQPEVREVAEKLNATVAQVLIAWAVHRGTSAIPKSVTKERVKSNFKKIILPDAEFQKLQALDRHMRYNDPKEWGAQAFEEAKEEELKAASQAWAKAHPLTN